MNKREIWRLIYLLFLGQVISFSLAVTSFTSSLIADLGTDTPLTQSFFTYLFLSLVYGPILLCRRHKLLVPWYWYVGLALVDVQGNFLVVKAYQYSSITSVTLLDCWTIPWVMILTWIVLKTRYSVWQFISAGICVVGLVLVLFSDAGVSGGGGNSRPLLGDVLVIAGTLCYALSNVGEEFCVKKKDRVEVVAMLGIFGAIISVLQILLIERKNLEEVKWTPTMISLFAGFATSTFLFYTIVPFVLQMSGSTLFNLSLLTSDMWAVLIRIFFYHQQVDWLYYLAFGTVAIGLIIYSLNEHKMHFNLSIEDEQATVTYERLSPENPEANDYVLSAEVDSNIN
ncbi:solute carrier family 35 protein (DUF914) [Rhynchospora pubera]|uniref:Solute carrier family 35 protein (DUF914) n=1 Tax=Rhynchospora pubera TaxID=906938 RepID=A0AAV8BYN4_9POAL|nr:solute carrier family 35 protein (DUF914) [Rhynchospora pubera]